MTYKFVVTTRYGTILTFLNQANNADISSAISA
jgi:hypothetical protein